ncbi:MAG: PAS domain-containing protein [Anaerolineales bacterium]|nr:PAS domain-containing protein [Anaerolineales bacterium]
MTKRSAPSEKSRRGKRPAPGKKASSRPPRKKTPRTQAAPPASPQTPTPPLQESDLFRTLMDHTTDRIYFKDRQSRFLYINRSTASFFNLSRPEQAVGKTDFDFFSEEHARQAFDDEQRIIATGESLIGFEEKETWPDGRETWVSSSKLPFRDRDGRIVGIFGTSRDITERKSYQLSLLRANEELENANRALQKEMAERARADSALARERNLFRTMMDNTPDRIYFKDRKSRFLLINKAQAEKFGLAEPAGAVGKTDFDFFTDEHARQAYDDEQKIIATADPLIGIEEKETWPDGRVTWVSSSKLPFRDRHGNTIGVFGISRDITDYKLGEEARIRAATLREANVELERINAALETEIAERKRVEKLLAHERNLFRAMMDNTTDRIYFKDRGSHFLLINRSLAAHFGIPDPAEAEGKTDFDYFTDEHARQAFTDEQRLVASEEPYIGKEEKETWPDGHATWVSSTKFPLRDLEGRIIGTFGISRDITERKAIELSVLQANEEYEKANRALEMEIAERRRAEAELARERDLFRTMMNSTTDFIYFKDAQNRYQLINRSMAAHFHLPDPAEAVGKTDFDYFTDEHARQAFQEEEQIITGGEPLIAIEEKETWPDGRETWLSTSKFPMRDTEGRIVGTFGISREITERKNLEMAIQIANEKLSIMVNWLEGRNREISVLSEMGNLLEACRSPEEAYPIIAQQMNRLIPVDAGMLYRFDKERKMLDCVVRWGADPGPADSFAPEECKGIQSGQAFIMASAIPAESSCRHVAEASKDDMVYLCAPLLSQGEMIGVLHLRGKRKEGGQTLPDLKRQLAVMAADHIALALSNLTLQETLRRQSIRDELTGLFNRRYLEESLQLELNNARDHGRSLGVIMIDVDRLKAVNDSCGHEAGDALLRALGKWLQANIRTGDISCRYGGDEFVLILPQATLDSTVQRARQICEGIRKLTFTYREKPLEATSVSVGVASFPEHGDTRDSLLKSLDEALYRAKEQGRNRVVIAGG